MLMTLVLSACQMGCSFRGQQHGVENQYIPLRSTPYVCPICQKSLEKKLVCEYERHRTALVAEQQELGDFGPQNDFFHS